MSIYFIETYRHVRQSWRLILELNSYINFDIISIYFIIILPVPRKVDCHALGGAHTTRYPIYAPDCFVIDFIN